MADVESMAVVVVAKDGAVATAYEIGSGSVFTILGALDWLKTRFSQEQVMKEWRLNLRGIGLILIVGPFFSLLCFVAAANGLDVSDLDIYWKWWVSLGAGCALLGRLNG